MDEELIKSYEAQYRRPEEGKVRFAPVEGSGGGVKLHPSDRDAQMTRVPARRKVRK